MAPRPPRTHAPREPAASTLLSTWAQQKHLPSLDPALHNEKVAKGTRIGAYELTRKLGEVWYAASLFV